MEMKNIGINYSQTNINKTQFVNFSFNLGQ